MIPPKKLAMLPMLLLLLLLYMACAFGCVDKSTSSARPEEVRFITVTEERLVLTSSLPGRVAPIVVSEVRPQVDGIILERLFEEGKDVSGGQVLYRIDPAQYQAAFNKAMAALAEAEANVTAVALREKRYQNLAKSNAISQQELDNVISAHGQARARIALAKAELETAAINLAHTQITAPVSGRIGASSVTPGALVTANQPAALAVIRQHDPVYVDFAQPSADNLRLRRALAQGKMSANGDGARVRLILENGSAYTRVAHKEENNSPQGIEGTLLFSEISVGQTTGSIGMRAVFSNPDGLLLPGMYAKAVIEEGVLDNAVLVPQGSVLPDGTGWHFVFLLEKQQGTPNLYRVARRSVILDRPYNNRWVVKSGLVSGDVVVVEGTQKAVAGELVKGLAARSASIPATDLRTEAR